jgi:hypothetical protein
MWYLRALTALKMSMPYRPADAALQVTSKTRLPTHVVPWQAAVLVQLRRRS